MVFHLVLFRPRPNLSAAEREAFAAAFETAVRSISSVRRVHVGRRVLHGPDYERATTEHFEFAGVIEFEDLAGLQVYLRHPAHQELGARFYASIAAGLVYDFEMRTLEGMGEVLKSTRA